MNQQLKNMFRAGYSGTYLTAWEEQRVEAEIASIAKDIGFGLYVWTVTDGLIGPVGDPEPKQFSEADGTMPMSPPGLLDMMNKCLPEKSIVIAKDFHLFINESNPLMIRKAKDCLQRARENNRRLVVLGCRFQLCPELEKEFASVDFSLPDKEQLRVVLVGIAEEAGITLNGNTDSILDASSGMTTTEAADAFALAVIESGGHDIPPAIVHREKANAVKKSGILEVVPPRIKLEDIGGLQRLTAELWEKRNLFTKAARDYGLQSPRGVLVCGNAGTGKSLTASACGSIFNVPLLKLDAGRLFGSLVGESERNWRTVFSTAKTISPCILWIDEADGLFAGGKSSGQTDGGTTSRVLKSILQDMQFNSEGIFYFFTANDIDGFPDPLIDRLDIWSVDLPNQAERESIWKIHIAKRKRSPEQFDLPGIAALTDGFSGRQIEQVWLKALTIAFNDGGREPTNDDVTNAAGQFVPTSKTMAEQIDARRRRLANRAKPASEPEVVVPLNKARKLA